jgi:pentatricopeptide repeat protein
LDFLFASGPLPFWEVSKLHARVLLSLGCISDALRIFERLQSWNDVVNCHLGAGQPEKAESLIRKLLEEKDDPNYFCLLGDITNNADLYWKAIEVL